MDKLKQRKFTPHFLGDQEVHISMNLSRGLVTVSYISQDQEHFTISKADWNELWRKIMQIIRSVLQHADMPLPQSATAGF